MKLFALLAATAAALTAAPAIARTLVPVPKFKTVEVNGGAIVRLRHGPVQRVTLLKGSTDISSIEVQHPRGDEHRLVIDTCRTDCNLSRYDLEVEIVTPNIDAVAVNGGGTITASGAFPRQRSVAAAVSRGGEIDLRALPVRDAAAAVDSGGKLLIRANGSLAATIDGGGDIRYWGDPQTVSAIDGGGTVRKGN